MEAGSGGQLQGRGQLDLPDRRSRSRVQGRHGRSLGAHPAKATGPRIVDHIEVGDVPGAIDDGEVIATIRKVPPAVGVSDIGHLAEVVPRGADAKGRIAVAADVESETKPDTGIK